MRASAGILPPPPASASRKQNEYKCKCKIGKDSVWLQFSLTSFGIKLWALGVLCKVDSVIFDSGPSLDVNSLSIFLGFGGVKEEGKILLFPPLVFSTGDPVLHRRRGSL